MKLKEIIPCKTVTAIHEEIGIQSQQDDQSGNGGFVWSPAANNCEVNRDDEFLKVDNNSMDGVMNEMDSMYISCHPIQVKIET
jgi:hypothetical protein